MVACHQLVVERKKFGLGERRSACQRPAQGRVSHQTAPCHQLGKPGIARGHALAIRHGVQIPVVAEGAFVLGDRVGKGLLPHLSFIIVRPQAGVDDEQGDGVAGKHF